MKIKPPFAVAFYYTQQKRIVQPQVRCINVRNTENLANESSLQNGTVRSIIKLTRDLLVFITVGSDGNPFFMIEIIVYRKECDWCYWWQDTASDDHRSCCFNGSVSDENKNSWILFSMLIGFGYDLWRGGWNGTAFFISGTGIPLVVLGWLFYFRMLGSGDIKLFLCTGRNYGTSTYSVVYLVCISDRRAAFTGHSDLVRRFQPANPIFVKYMKCISGQANGKLITEMGLRGKIFISRFLSL